MTKHIPIDMGIRSIKCSCGRVITIPPKEAAGVRTDRINDMLLDRFAVHKESKK